MFIYHYNGYLLEMGLNKKNEYLLSEYLMDVSYMEKTVIKEEDIEVLYHFSETLAQQP